MNAKTPPPTLPKDAALFLDFDGTLVDFADRPDGVLVPAELIELLKRLRTVLDGALAILSGRTLEEIDTFLKGMSVAASGNHGRDSRWADGSINRAAAPDVSKETAALEAFAETRPGLLVEKKMGAVALHYRQAPQYADEVERFVHDLARDRSDIVAMPHKMLVELKDAASNKGAALKSHLQRAPFHGRLPVFVGDDANDEPAMVAAQAMGGFAVKVGEGESNARYRLPDVAAVHAWLGEAVA